MAIRKNKSRKNKSYKKFKEQVRKVTKSKSLDTKFLQDNEEVLERLSKSASKYGIFWDKQGNFKKSRAEVVGDINPITDAKKKSNRGMMVVIGALVAGGIALGSLYVMNKEKVNEVFAGITGNTIEENSSNLSDPALSSPSLNDHSDDFTVEQRGTGVSVEIDNTDVWVDMTSFIDSQLQNIETAPSKITETISDNLEATYNLNYSTGQYDYFVTTSSGKIFF